jgi:hypothetical protein
MPIVGRFFVLFILAHFAMITAIYAEFQLLLAVKVAGLLAGSVPYSRMKCGEYWA